MSLILVQLLNGLQSGLLIFLAASGLTLVFGILGVINLSHGSFYMLGAYLALTFTGIFGDVFLALALSMGMLSAQEEQLKDHPSIPGFPGYAIDTAKVTEFDSFEFPLEENNKAVEGKFWQITYQIKEGARKPSELEVVRNYEN